MAAYTNATNVAVLLNTTFGAATDPTNTEVNDLVTRVQAFIDTVTGRTWTSSTTTEIFDTFDDNRLSLSGFNYYPDEVQRVYFLNNRPVISVDSLQINSGGLSSENWETKSTGYAGTALLHGAEGYVEFHQQQPWPGFKNVKITYTYGVSSTPNDIKYACELLVADEIISAQQGGQPLTSVRVGGTSYSWDSSTQSAFREKAMAILAARGYTTKAEAR